MSFFDIVDVIVGFKDGGIVIVNIEKSKEEVFEKFKKKLGKFVLVDVIGIVFEIFGFLIINMVIFGVVVKVIGFVKFESV